MINGQGSDAPSPTMHELVSWMGYFQLADSPRVQDLGEWFRRRMRQIRWKGWKRPKTRQAMPRKFGINEQFSREWGGTSKGYWRVSGSLVLARALPNTYWGDLGLRVLKPTWQRLRSAG
ncbi:group II intron maturase-specific domain-containing protein [Streptomyces sp. NPDC056690]|uniref:group II intron maturase-specific domain-containing protein n=1 Tax=unclassified Streptomyces TaxID=2593676 RepID=UPI00362D4A62